VVRIEAVLPTALRELLLGVVERYADEAEGVLEKEGGRLWVTRVTLRPRIVFAGTAPSAEALAELHAQAHAGCLIANSVTTVVTVA